MPSGGSAMSGHSAITFTSGKRSIEAKAVRGSMMVTSYPSSAAIGAKAWLMCTAPVMTRRLGGTCTATKNLPAGVSSTPLCPLRIRLSIAWRSGSRATSAAFTSRCSPVAISVTTTAARRAARSEFNARSRSSFMASVHLLHVNPNGAAAGQADLPGGLVGDTEFERLRLAALDDVERLGHHRAFDATARDRAEEFALLVVYQTGADRPRRRAPRLDHGGKRHVAALLAPFRGCFQDILIAGKHFVLHFARITGATPTQPPSHRWIAGFDPAMT